MHWLRIDRYFSSEKTKQKALAKTQEYLPGLAPKEDRAASIKSEQTGKNIEVGKSSYEQYIRFHTRSNFKIDFYFYTQ